MPFALLAFETNTVPFDFTWWSSWNGNWTVCVGMQARTLVTISNALTFLRLCFQCIRTAWIILNPCFRNKMPIWPYGHWVLLPVSCPVSCAKDLSEYHWARLEVSTGKGRILSCLLGSNFGAAIISGWLELKDWMWLCWRFLYICCPFLAIWLLSRDMEDVASCKLLLISTMFCYVVGMLSNAELSVDMAYSNGWALVNCAEFCDSLKLCEMCWWSFAPDKKSLAAWNDCFLIWKFLLF